MPPWLASHLICELYHDIIFLLRVKFVDNFSTFNYSSCASAIRHGHGNSRVETRSSEQTMLSDEAHVLLVTDSSSEEDSETDHQSYFPPEVHALTWQGYVSHIVRMVSCIAMSFS